MICVTDLKKSFGRRVILDSVTMPFAPGECLLLSGDNGAGKTTLLRILGGIEKPDHALVQIDGALKPWKKARRRIQQEVMYLHQQPYLFDGNVEYNLGYALPRGSNRRENQLLVQQALAWAGLQGLARIPARCLSGGERQRIALARAWLRAPGLLLLDEPTSNMDQRARKRTLDLLGQLKHSGMALLIASHDPHHFSGLANRRLRLHNGHLVTVAGSGAPAAKSAKVIPLRRDYA